jgi:hypothetical protein
LLWLSGFGWRARLHNNLVLKSRQGETANIVASCVWHLGASDVREWLIVCHLRSGKKVPARNELDLLLVLNPATQDELRPWFAQQEAGTS